MTGRGALLIVGPYPPYRGGIAHFTAQLHAAVEAAGRPVTGVSFARQYPSFLFPGTSQEVPPEEARDAPGAARLLDSLRPWTGRRVARAAVQAGATEVVFMVWMPFFVPVYASAARALRRAGIRCTALVHNALPHERQPFAGPLTRYLIRRMDRVIALSEPVAQDLRTLGAGDVTVQAHPVYDRFGEVLPASDARVRLGLPTEGRVLLFFGLVRAYKGLDLLVEAMARLPEGVHLAVAGEFYEPVETYREQIAALGLESRVTLAPGYVPDGDVASWFSAADVVVQPYRHATQSGVVQTAFQFACPVVVTAVGALPDMVRDGEDGLVVPPGDVKALAAALVRALDAPLLERLQRGADEARRRNTWPHFARLFVS